MAAVNTILRWLMDLFLRFVRGDRTANAVEVHAEDGKISKDVWINRGIALAVGLACILLALVISDIFKALDLAYGFLSGCVFVPVIASFILKKVSPKAGLISLALSALVVASTMAYGEVTGQADFAIGGNWPITFGITVGFLSYVIVSLVDSDKVVPNIDIPVNEGR